MYKIRIIIGFTCLLQLFIIAIPAFAQEWKATVAANGATLYTRMDSNSPKKGELTMGTHAIVSWTSNMSDGQWCALKDTNGYDAGYINCKYLTKGHLSRRQINSKGIIAGSDKVTVLLYSRAGCPYSSQAEKLLSTMDINLIKYDIRHDKYRRKEMKMKGGSGVPFIDIEGIYIRGYSKQGILDAIARKSTGR